MDEELQQNQQDIQTYVYEFREYVLTGRSATKQTIANKTMYLVEIRPISADEYDTDLNKWVKIEDLFTVSNDSEIDIVDEF